MDKPPPQHLEAERALLGALCVDFRAAWPDVESAGLRAEDFYRRSHQELFRRIAFLAWKGEEPDPVLLADWGANGRPEAKQEAWEELQRLVEGHITAANANLYARKVKEAAARREIIRRSSQAIEASYERDTDAGEVISGVLEDLEALRDGAGIARPFEVISGGAFSELEFDPRHLIIGNEVLSAGELLFIMGEPKAGKSMLTLDLAVSLVVHEGLWCGFNVYGPKKVLYLVGEGGKRSFLQRWQKRTSSLSRETCDRVGLWFPHPELLSLEEPEGLRRVESAVVAGGYDVIVFDPLINFHNLDENSTTDMRLIAGRLIELKERTGAAIVVVHHTRKIAAGEKRSWRFDEGRGSSVLRGAYDGGILFGRRTADDTDDDRKMVFELRNAEREPSPMVVRLDRLTAVYEVVTTNLGGRPAAVEVTWQEIVKAIGRIGPATYDEISGETKVSRRRLERWLPDLLRRNILTRERHSPRAPWRWSIPPEDLERPGELFTGDEE